MDQGLKHANHHPRHGARLDAANSQWHLTSPTPYDPPLTYGGWTQSRALGARIASLLKARELSHHHHPHLEEEPDSSATGNENAGGSHGGHKSHRTRRRKHRIVIHSSPFLRCVQTSIAISAGVGQYEGLTTSSHLQSTPKPHVLHSGPPHLHPEFASSPMLSAIPEPDDEEDATHPDPRRKGKGITKARLRIDAFLGEWLSPDYFEAITPPPSSVLMVAGAKADLLRRGDLVDGAEDSSNLSSSQGNFPGGWSSHKQDPDSGATSDEDGPVTGMSGLTISAASKRDRASSHNAAGNTACKSGLRAVRQARAACTFDSGYVPPQPRYAISPSDPIPPGYVAHARDACVNIDYQWDSMRPPQEWGNGGEYGEEWSSMHKRFRKGLQQMILWYRTNEPSSRRPFEVSDSNAAGDDDDDDTDTVLILVTHGAGCNALIGALTNQPVLLDVGMASLTMAVRKHGAGSEHAPVVQSMRRRSSIDLGISQDYEVPLIASTEHLRAGSNPLTVPQLQTQARNYSPHDGNYRQRFGSPTAHGPSYSPIDNGFHLPDSALHGGLRRSATSASPGGSRANTGLWTKPVAEPNGDVQKKSEGMNGTSENAKLPWSIEGKLGSALDNNPVRKNSQPGLWGAAAPTETRGRDPGPKRRWTFNEHR